MTVDELCQELAQLYRDLGDAITPRRSEADRTVGGDRALLVSAALTGTGRGDGTSRRAVPGWKPPLDAGAGSALDVQEGLETAAVHLANTARVELGHRLRSRRALHALETLPSLLDALPEGHGLHRRVPVILDSHRRRARDVLGRSRDVLWLGECPTTFEVAVDVLVRVAGAIVLVEGDLGCWTLDHAAMIEDGGEREIWRRSRLALPRDEVSPDVQCWACRGRWDPVQMAGLVAAHLRERAAG